MKKLLIFLMFGFLICPIFAQPKVKHTFLLYTNDATEYKDIDWHMSHWIESEIKMLEAVRRTVPSEDLQVVAYEPKHLDYDERSVDDDYALLTGILNNPVEEVYQAVDSLKKAMDINIINTVMFRSIGSKAERANTAMLYGVSTTWRGYVGQFLQAVTPPEGEHTVKAYRASVPDDYPDAHENDEYTTLGGGWAQLYVDEFARIDTAEYFDIPFPLGDEDHNVLDPEKGWQLHQVFDQSGTDLGFQTVPDTLTIQQGLHRTLELYPGWNDSETGDVLYTAGGRFGDGKDIYTDGTHCGYQQNRFYYNPTDLGGYGVAIPHLQDAFALEYILVQFVEHLEVPGLDVPDNISQGDTFTITLTGTPELMTSWIPEITISGVETELISVDEFTYTYRVLTSGKMSVTLHHNSLQVLDDEVVQRTVNPTSVEERKRKNIRIYPNPTDNRFFIQLSFFIKKMVLYDMQGRKRKEIVPTARSVCVQDLPTGVYILRIYGLNTLVVHKIIKY